MRFLGNPAGRRSTAGHPAGTKMFYYRADHEEGSAGSITGADTPITINPVNHWSGQWFWWGIRWNRLGGKTPHFLLAKADKWGLFVGEKLGVWARAADTDDWTNFDNMDIGAVNLDLYNNTPFPYGMIYLSPLPMYPFSRTARKVAEWAVDGRVGETASTIDLILGNATARNVGDGSGRIAPALPFYGFKISSGGANPKNKAILTARNHAPETPGGFALEGAIDWLLAGSAEAEFLLDWFDVFVYPCLNPQGVWAGWFGGNPEHAGQHNDISAGFEDLDAFLVAMNADTGGAADVGFDYHAYSDNGSAHFVCHNAADVINVAFRDAYKVYEAAFTNITDATVVLLQEWWLGTLGATLAGAVEQCVTSVRSVANYKSSGQYSVRALAALQAKGHFTNGPGVGSRDMNGTTDHVSRASPFTPAAGQPMSVSFWLAADRNNVGQGLWIASKAGDTYDGIYIWNNGTLGAGRMTFIVEGATDGYRSSINGFIPADGIFHHYVVTWDGVLNPMTGVRMYKDGVESASYAAVQNGSGANTASGKWVIGGFYEMDNFNINGRMAQNCVWNRVITPTEIANLAAGRAPDLAAPLGMQSYLKSNTASLADAVDAVDWVADGTTQLTGVGNGPAIVYP